MGTEYLTMVNACSSRQSQYQKYSSNANNMLYEYSNNMQYKYEVLDLENFPFN